MQHNLASMPSSIRAALQRNIKDCLYGAGLARVADLQEAFTGDGEFKFNPDEIVKNGKPWDTLTNQTMPEPDTKIVHVMTVSTDASIVLVAPITAIVNIVNSIGRLNAADPIKSLTDSGKDEAGIVAAMVAITTQMEKHISTENMQRDFNYVTTFRRKLDALVSNKSLLDPGGDAIARLYLNFLKCIGWFAGNAAWEVKAADKGLTFNLELAYRILSDMRACVPDDSVEVLLPYIKGQMTIYTTKAEMDEAALQAKKRAAEAKKSVAKKSTAKGPADVKAPAVTTPPVRRVPPGVTPARKPGDPVPEVKEVKKAVPPAKKAAPAPKKAAPAPAPKKAAPAKPTPAPKAAPVKPAASSSKFVAAEAVPAEEFNPVDETPVAEPAADETPADETAAEPAADETAAEPSDEPTADETAAEPADETAADEPAAEEPAADETPANETPAEEPVEDIATESVPAVETKVEVPETKRAPSVPSTPTGVKPAPPKGGVVKPAAPKAPVKAVSLDYDALLEQAKA